MENGRMSAARHDEPEQEVSIRQREHELFRSQDDSTSPTTRPFVEYLRETPPAPLPTWVLAVLWASAFVVALLFVAALWRSVHRAKARAPRKPPTTSSSRSPALSAPIAAISPQSPRSSRLPASPNQESQRS
jgi:hypothetical protein